MQLIIIGSNKLQRLKDTTCRGHLLKAYTKMIIWINNRKKNSSLFYSGYKCDCNFGSLKIIQSSFGSP